MAKIPCFPCITGVFPILFALINQYFYIWFNIIGDDDYNSGPFSATFRAGTTESSFDVLIRDDKILEDNEVFLLKIESSFPPVGTIDEAKVTIVDDDGKFVIFIGINVNI